MGHAQDLRWCLDGLPPALVLGAALDGCRDDARNYAARLDGSGVEVEHIEYADTAHAFLNFPSALDVAQDAVNDIAGYLKAAFR